MPRFAEKPSHFWVETSWDEQPVKLKVRWTPAADDAFACLFQRNDAGKLTVSEAEAYRLLLQQTVEWEGVEDEEGKPVPYSAEAFSARLPGLLKVKLIPRFIDEALTFSMDSAANPT